MDGWIIGRHPSMNRHKGAISSVHLFKNVGGFVKHSVSNIRPCALFGNKHKSNCYNKRECDVHIKINDFIIPEEEIKAKRDVYVLGEHAVGAIQIEYVSVQLWEYGYRTGWVRPSVDAEDQDGQKQKAGLVSRSYSNRRTASAVIGRSKPNGLTRRGKTRTTTLADRGRVRTRRTD